jgi:hypothetical protein
LKVIISPMSPVVSTWMPSRISRMPSWRSGRFERSSWRKTQRKASQALMPKPAMKKISPRPPNRWSGRRV